jgi:diguanylate cyclase (GGDEF)-like protein/PAS domain S-box-containing protein
VYANPVAATLLGWAPGPVAGDDPVVMAAAAGGPGGQARLELTRDGRQLLVRVMPLGAEAADLAVAVEDVTGLRKATSARRVAEQRFTTAFEHAPSGMAVVGLDGTFLRVNEAWCSITGFAAAQLIGQGFAVLAPPGEPHLDVVPLAEALAGRRDHHTVDQRCRRPDGTDVWVELRVGLAVGEEGEPLHFIAQIADITARKQGEEERREREGLLNHQATHDVLTGLPNRIVLDQHLRNELTKVNLGHQRRPAVLFCDLDGFKQVNDRWGHGVGDEVLRSVAGWLRDACRATDLVVRHGGDEFVVVADTTDYPDDVVHLARRITEALARPVGPDGAPSVDLAVSIGIAVAERGDSPAALLGRADAAAYEAKRSRRGIVAVGATAPGATG